MSDPEKKEEVQAAPEAVPFVPPKDLSTTRLRKELKENRIAPVIEALVQMSPGARAQRFLQLRTAEQIQIIKNAPAELAASILSDCDSASLTPLLGKIELDVVGPALRQIPPDNLADIVLRLSPELQKSVLERIDPELREDVRKLMSFPPDSAGGLMTTRYLSVPEVVTVAKALELLRMAKLGESPSYVYVVDAGGRLVGTVTLRKLLLTPPRKEIASIATRNVVKLKAASHRDEIVNLFGQHHFISLPVVDEKDRLVGIVTFDDVMAAMREREEQIVRAVTGVDPREALKETLVAARGRIPWICVTIAGGLACTFIGGLFQHTLEQIVVLGIFIPIVLALGESIGAQTTTVTISTILGHGTRPPFAAFILKEILIGVLVGLFAGVVVAATSMLWHWKTNLGLMIGGAIFISILWATFLGVLIPGAMNRMRVDPAIASGPLVLALSDVSTLVVYFGSATLLLSILKA